MKRPLTQYREQLEKINLENPIVILERHGLEPLEVLALCQELAEDHQLSRPAAIAYGITLGLELEAIKCSSSI